MRPSTSNQSVEKQRLPHLGRPRTLPKPPIRLQRLNPVEYSEPLSEPVQNWWLRLCAGSLLGLLAKTMANISGESNMNLWEQHAFTACPDWTLLLMQSAAASLGEPSSRPAGPKARGTQPHFVGRLGGPSTEVGLSPPGLRRCMAQALSDATDARSPKLPNESLHPQGPPTHLQAGLHCFHCISQTSYSTPKGSIR